VLEGQQRHLAQRPLVGFGGDLEPVGLDVVGDEVLHARGDAGGLEAGDVGGGDERGQHRILRQALEVRPPSGDAAGSRRAQQDMGALGEGLDAAGRLRPARTRSTSQVAPRAAPQGKDTEGGPPANSSPRAPLGPSVTLRAGSPGDAGTFHQSAPDSDAIRSPRSSFVTTGLAG
jgi:hypothetical protein